MSTEVRAPMLLGTPMGGKVRVELTLFHDVLCAWCLQADARLRGLLHDEFKDQVLLRYKAFPTRQVEAIPSAREAKSLAKHHIRGARSMEGWKMVPDLWTGNDPPLSSIPPLVALEAATLQGPGPHQRLWEAMRRAAFWQGINIARRDVLIELAEREGLDVAALIAAMDTPATEARVLAEHDEAEARNINGVPALVMRPLERYAGSPEWVIAGCRDIWEYRELIFAFHDRLLSENPERLRH